MRPTPKGWKRFLVVPDTHGQFIHQKNAAKCIEFKKDFKPHKTIHLGDFIDATCLRHGASEAEQGVSFGDDWIAAKRFLEELRPNVVLMGNHERRLWKLIDSPRALVSEYAQHLVDDIISFMIKGLKAEWLPYHARDGVYEITTGKGRLAAMHGYHANMHACHKHAQVYGNCIIGHIHRIEMSTAARDDGAICHSPGWLGDIKHMDYIGDKTGQFRWGNGWIWGYYNERTGAWKVNQAEDKDGAWII